METKTQQWTRDGENMLCLSCGHPIIEIQANHPFGFGALIECSHCHARHEMVLRLVPHHMTNEQYWETWDKGYEEFIMKHGTKEDVFRLLDHKRREEEWNEIF